MTEADKCLDGIPRNHIAALVAMLIDISLKEASLPWECEKIENFWGAGSDYAWRIDSCSTGSCLAYLRSSVDAPSLIALVNGFADRKLDKEIVA